MSETGDMVPVPLSVPKIRGNRLVFEPFVERNAKGQFERGNTLSKKGVEARKRRKNVESDSTSAPAQVSSQKRISDFIKGHPKDAIAQYEKRDRRRYKVTPEMVNRMKAMILAGVPVRAVCDVLKIDQNTFYRWVQRGETERRYRAWREAYLEARGIHAVIPCQVVFQQIRGDPNNPDPEKRKEPDPYLAYRYLRGRFPEVFARDNRALQIQQILQQTQQQVQVDLSRLTREQLLELRSALEVLLRLRQGLPSLPAPEVVE